MRDISEHYSPERIIFFGSRVKGTNLETSDIDMIIVSDKFSGIPFPQRISDFYTLLKISENVDVICLSQDEFDERSNKITVVREAVREGIEI